MQALAVIAAAGVAGAAGCSATSENAEPQPTRRAPSRSRAVVLPLSSPRPRVAEPVAGAHAGAPGRRAAAVASARTGVAGELRRAVGQKIMTRMSGLYPSQRLLWRVRRGQVGGVILFADNVRAPAQVTRAVAALQAAAARGGNPRPPVAVDQGGGDVRRLRWAPPRLSAAALGSNSATASRQGQAAGRALRKVGINLDLAPVLDVPAVPESFLGGRAFGPTAQAVGRAGC